MPGTDLPDQPRGLASHTLQGSQATEQRLCPPSSTRASSFLIRRLQCLLLHLTPIPAREVTEVREKAPRACPMPLLRPWPRFIPTTTLQSRSYWVHFTGEATEAQRGGVTYSRSHSQEVAELAFEPRPIWFQSPVERPSSMSTLLGCLVPLSVTALLPRTPLPPLSGAPGAAHSTPSSSSRQERCLDSEFQSIRDERAPWGEPHPTWPVLPPYDGETEALWGRARPGPRIKGTDSYPAGGVVEDVLSSRTQGHWWSSGDAA